LGVGALCVEEVCEGAVDVVGFAGAEGGSGGEVPAGTGEEVVAA
jgi:hypothetical protein